VRELVCSGISVRDASVLDLALGPAQALSGSVGFVGRGRRGTISVGLIPAISRRVSAIQCFRGERGVQSAAGR